MCVLIFLSVGFQRSDFWSLFYRCPFLGVPLLMDSVFFYILPFHRCKWVCGKALRESSLLQKFDWRISLHLFSGMVRTKLWHQSVFLSLKVTFKFLSFHPASSSSSSSSAGYLQTPSLHFQDTEHRCSLASFTFPTCGNPFLSRLGKLKLQHCHHDWTCMPSSPLWIQCMPSYSLQI